MKCSSTYFWLIALILFSRYGWAQQANITLQADQHIVAVGEPISVTVSIVIEGQEGYDRYNPPEFKGFDMSGGGMQSQNIEIVNFRVRRKESYTYQIIPIKEGRFSIGPASIQIGNRLIKSGTVVLDVKKSGVPSPNLSPSQNASPMPPDVVSGQPLPSIFINAAVSPRKVFIGQQILATWQLFTQSDVLGFQPTHQPTTDNFWSEDLTTPRSFQFERQIVQGRVFYAAVVARKALFPQKIGKLTIGSLKAQVRAVMHFAAGALERSSDPVNIEVMPLPKEGQPSDFDEQNVGEFALAVSLSRETVKAGDAVTFKIIIRGNGNLRELKAPMLPPIDGLKIYDPKVSENLILDEQVSGEKIVEYLILPTRSGKIHFPALHLDFFNPKTEKYERISSQPIVLTVTGELPVVSTANNVDTKKNILGPDIRPPRPAKNLVHRGRSNLLDQITIALFAFPVVFVFVFFVFGKIRARIRRQTEGSISRAIARQVRQHLNKAVDLKNKGEAVAFFGELTLAIYAQLKQRMKSTTDGLTQQELALQMQQSGFPLDLIKETMEQLDACNFGRFAKVATEQAQLDMTLQKIRKLIRDIERVSL